MTYTDWEVGGHSDEESEDCVRVSAKGWEDRRCGEELPFLCQVDLYPGNVLE